MTRLSEHFTLEELTRTSVKNVRNVPNASQVENLTRLCRWLEALRKNWNLLYGDGDEPVIVNSGFRSEKVNRAVGGVSTSNHLTGCAADIRCLGVEQAFRYATILLDYADITRQDFDELLIERSRKGTYWVHLAVRPSGNRRKTGFV